MLAAVEGEAADTDGVDWSRWDWDVTDAIGRSVALSRDSCSDDCKKIRESARQA